MLRCRWLAYSLVGVLLLLSNVVLCTDVSVEVGLNRDTVEPGMGPNSGTVESGMEPNGDSVGPGMGPNSDTVESGMEPNGDTVGPGMGPNGDTVEPDLKALMRNLAPGNRVHVTHAVWPNSPDNSSHMHILIIRSCVGRRVGAAPVAAE
jgi:hypothetical protein